MEEEYFTYTFLIDSFDHRDGNKEREIREKLSFAFNEANEKYEIHTEVIEKVGFSNHANVVLKCQKPKSNVCDIIKYYRAEKSSLLNV